MSRAKARFPVPWMTAQTVLAAHALLRARRSPGARRRWVAAAVNHGAPVLFLGHTVLARRARTPDRIWAVHLAAGAGLTALAAQGRQAGPSLPLAAAGSASTLVYDVWYSRFGRTPSDAVAAEAILPDDLEFTDIDGATVRSGDLRGRPTAWLFFRGNWCPLCMAQIREIADRYAEIDRRGGTVVLVSPQDEGHTRDLAARFDVPFRYLRDDGLRAATRLGIVHPDGVPGAIADTLGYEADTVLPTLLVTDAQGRIVFSDQTDNYRVRPEPDVILAKLEEAGLPTPASAPATATA